MKSEVSGRLGIIVTVCLLLSAAFLALAVYRFVRNGLRSRAEEAVRSLALRQALRAGPGGPKQCLCGARYPANATWCLNCNGRLRPATRKRG